MEHVLITVPDIAGTPSENNFKIEFEPFGHITQILKSPK
jgi:hypothetical protein